MTMQSVARRLFLAALLSIAAPVLFDNVNQAQNLRADYSYSPHRWMTPLGLEGDWHKPLVDQTGALVYDNGPGPYAIPHTRIAASILSADAASYDQTMHNPRVPVIETRSDYHENILTTRALSAIPQHSWMEDGNFQPGRVQRHNGVVYARGWASPPAGTDPAFSSVAYGTNRLILYSIRVPENAERTVVLGFADSYREKGSAVKRLMDLTAEGAPVKTIDVVSRTGQNAPEVEFFEARDENSDGFIDIRVDANLATVDGNIFISAIWLFEKEVTITTDEVISGKATPYADVYVDCGREDQLLQLPPRTDLLYIEPTASTDSIVVTVDTGRRLSIAGSEILYNKSPYVRTDPVADRISLNDDGAILYFPPESEPITVAVFTESHHLPASGVPDFETESTRLYEYWMDSDRFPWDKIVVPDSTIQAIFDGSIRTIYQLAERVDGQLQTQPGPSVYRGLWASNQPRAGRALTHLGDFSTPRSSLKSTFRHQKENGQILILTPPTLLKETGLTIHATYLHARMSRDREFLESYWDQLVEAATWIIDARKQTTDSTALNFGLMPSGTSDGGVGGIIPEYTTVYWGLLALRNMADAATWLGKPREAREYEKEFADFMAAFRRGVERDSKEDASGNSFLPVRMEFDPEKHYPQRSQTQFSHMVYPGRLFSKNDPLVVGNMGMLEDAPKAQGITLTTGWLANGLQPFVQNTEASARLYLGQVDSTIQELYDIANHAAPTHIWIEEQRPVHLATKATGDVPHSSAAAEYINLVRYLIIMEDGERLDLLKGVPSQWLAAGGILEANDVPTEYGQLNLRVSVSEDRSQARLQVASENDANDEIDVFVHLRGFKQAGFVLPGGQPLPDLWGMKMGDSLDLNFERDR